MTSYDISLRPGNIWKLQFLILSSTRWEAREAVQFDLEPWFQSKRMPVLFQLMTTTPATCWMFSVFSPEPWDLLASLLIKFQDQSRVCKSETKIFVVCLVVSVTCFILFSSLQKLRYSTPIYFSNFFRPYEGMGQPPTWRQPLTLWMVWTLWMAWMDWTVARP